MASCPSERWLVPLTRFCRNRSYARFSNRRSRSMSVNSRRATSAATAARKAGVGGRPSSVGVGNEQLLCREESDDARTGRGDDDLLLDAGRGVAVGGRAERLQRED